MARSNQLEWGLIVLALAWEVVLLPGPWAVVSVPLAVLCHRLLRDGLLRRWGG